MRYPGRVMVLGLLLVGCAGADDDGDSAGSARTPTTTAPRSTTVAALDGDRSTTTTTVAAATPDTVGQASELDTLRELFDAVAAGDRPRAERVASPEVVDVIQAFTADGTTMQVPNTCRPDATDNSGVCLVTASTGEAFTVVVAAPTGRWRVESFTYLGGGL